jgi:hypothetical protein
MIKLFSLISVLLSYLVAEVYHKLSTRKFTQTRNRLSVAQPQMNSKLMLKSSVVTVLYIISDKSDSGRQAAQRWRSIWRLLSLERIKDGHSPLSAQVLQTSQRGHYYV